MTSKYTRAAKGQMCQVRIPGVCNHNPETVIFAHLNGSGMGTKHRDIHGSFCCSDCHDAVDGRNFKVNNRNAFDYLSAKEIKLAHHEGMVRTQNLLIEMGILIL